MIENKKNNETVGIATIGYYIPSGVMTREAIAKLADIPLWVLTEKIGMEKNQLLPKTNILGIWELKQQYWL